MRLTHYGWTQTIHRSKEESVTYVSHVQIETSGQAADRYAGGWNPLGTDSVGGPGSRALLLGTTNS